MSGPKWLPVQHCPILKGGGEELAQAGSGGVMGKHRTFLPYFLCPLTPVSKFKYLDRILTASDDF